MALINLSFLTGILSLVGSILLYVAIAVLFAGVMGGGYYWLVYRKKQYNIDCILFVQRQNGLVMAVDKGGFITKKKSSKFKLLGRKQARIIPPDYNLLITNEYGKSTLFLYKYGEQDYVPVTLEFVKTNLIVTPIEGLSKDAVVQDIRELISDLDKPSLLEKWLIPITLLVSVLIIMAGLYFITSMLVKSISANTSAYLESAKMLSEAVKHIGGIVQQ